MMVARDVHSSAVEDSALPEGRRIRLGEWEETALLEGILVVLGGYPSTEAWVKGLVRTEKVVVLDRNPVAVEAVPIDLVVVVRHNLAAPVDNPEGGSLLAVGSLLVVGSLLGAELDCIDGKVDCSDRAEDHNPTGESLNICQQRNNN